MAILEFGAFQKLLTAVTYHASSVFLTRKSRESQARHGLLGRRTAESFNIQKGRHYLHIQHPYFVLI
jgi:hypothetical protein